MSDGIVTHITLGGPADVDLGDVLLLPGLINLHTHLELTHVPPPAGPIDFVSWVKALPLLTQAQAFAAIDDGLRQSLGFGVTRVMSVGRFLKPGLGRLRPTLGGQGSRVMQMQELITVGRSEAQIEAMIKRADQDADGYAPHAPYTVGPGELKRAAQACHSDSTSVCRPLTIHLAEHPFEAEFLQDNTGPLADLLNHFRIPREFWPRYGNGSVLAALGSVRPILVHCNFIGDDDLATLNDRADAVVFCPRTRERFGYCQPGRYAEMRCPLALGTDSAASGGDLNVMAEARHAYAGGSAGWFPEQIVQMVTSSPGSIVGGGRIQQDAPADLVAFPAESLEHLLTAPLLPSAVYLAGQRVTED